MFKKLFPRAAGSHIQSTWKRLTWTVRGFAGQKRIWHRNVQRRIAQERVPTARSVLVRDKGRDPLLRSGRDRAPARPGSHAQEGWKGTHPTDRAGAQSLPLQFASSTG